MRDVLNDLRDMPSEGDLTLIDLKKKIPSRNQMFTDKEPSSCHVVPILYHIKEKINEIKL
jgi:hypothetical protein